MTPSFTCGQAERVSSISLTHDGSTQAAEGGRAQVVYAQGRHDSGKWRVMLRASQGRAHRGSSSNTEGWACCGRAWHGWQRATREQGIRQDVRRPTQLATNKAPPSQRKHPNPDTVSRPECRANPNQDDGCTSLTVSTRPPVDETMGTVPYCMACSWIRPQGSKREGTRMKSAPAVIKWARGAENCSQGREYA